VEITGFIAEDAPDPRAGRRAIIAGLGVPVAGLMPQRHLEDRGELRYSSSGGPHLPDEVTISRTYLLWRNPEDHDDQVNLAELDDATRAALDAPLERPVPGWLLEGKRMLRYPRLWDAVQTHWTRPGGERPSAGERLLTHAEHILTNQFRMQLGLAPREWVARIPAAALQPREVVVDGQPRAGLLLDTDPFVLGLATELDDGRILTAVVARDALPHLVLRFSSDIPIDGAPQQD
jgi:hypothetical protein